MLIYKITIQCTNGVSSTKNVAVASLRLPGGEIKQAQFVEDGTIMLLYTESGNISFSTSSSVFES